MTSATTDLFYAQHVQHVFADILSDFHSQCCKVRGGTERGYFIGSGHRGQNIYRILKEELVLRGTSYFFNLETEDWTICVSTNPNCMPNFKFLTLIHS